MISPEKLHPRVAAAFYGRFPQLHPAQEAALEPLLAGRNVVLSAGTGSGKTEAVVVPLVSRGWSDAVRDSQTFILYICPTKALINDVAGRLRPILDTLGVRVAVRHGDRNELALAAKAHVLITTPESLNVLITARENCLKEVRAVVIDEVHLLYNSQRGLQLAILLHRLRRIVGGPVQWAALSATVARLDGIRDFLFGAQEQADLLAFPSDRPIEAHIRLLPSDAELRALISRLMEAPQRKLLLFANSRRVCEEISDLLQGDPSLRDVTFTHYSSLSPDLRESTEQQFSVAKRAICVATSTLEMGIDIGDIDAVVLYGVPSGVESFLQRIGRGNRRSNQTNAICLPTTPSTSVREPLVFATLVDLARAGRIPQAAPHQLYGAIGQQCLSLLQQRDGSFTRVQEFCDELGAFPYVNRALIEEVLGELAAKGYCQRHGFKNQYGATDDFWELVDQGLLFGNFPQGSQTIDLRHGKRLLGSAPRHNLLRVRTGTILRFAGRRWRVTRVEPHSIELEPSAAGKHDIDLSYGGAGRGGLDTFIAQHLWLRLFSITQATSDMENATWSRVVQHLTAIRSVCNVNSLPCVRTPRGIRFYTFGGTLLNSVLARWSGRSLLSATDLAIELDGPLDCTTLPATTEDLLSIARSLLTSSDKQTFFQQQLSVDLQEREWCEAWLRDAEIPALLHRLRSANVVEVTGNIFECMDSESASSLKKH